jgi:elongation factor Ts
LDKKPASIDALKELDLNGHKIADEITTQIGVIGEKLELSYYETVDSEYVASYIHQGNRLASIAGFNQANLDPHLGKDIVMQIASMNPIAIDQNDVPKSVIDKEIEIGKELAIQEGKPADMAEKIALGRLNKFYKENTLLNQQFVKDNKLSIREYLTQASKGLTVTAFKRFTLNI